ncbi:DUF1304 domain-containing protein [Leucobacter sp. UT-8R-CII-1-4]|uniref:DUF1304 domain-containing protein n=1 Tax=Leucobacter sp. UT-8R-CII-1-4 TaxID=3040075 RepID=UPI0024A9F6CC|nr:DUF1304 domain-containing protein [Leucobacter sp. UT-8R-CII-1-4]MDI6021939.1 DUF1304 domain-containing protein [Leucobacter sp. UT-8R-CII-1-4]
MTIVGIVLVALAALLHVYIFYMESLAWTSPRVRATFGTTEEGAIATKELAFNQGFYNLFLALTALLGIVLYLAGQPVVGLTLMFVGAGSMFAAALVLFLSSPEKRRAALTQGTLPLLGLVTLGLGTLIV